MCARWPATLDEACQPEPHLDIAIAPAFKRDSIGQSSATRTFLDCHGRYENASFRMLTTSDAPTAPQYDRTSVPVVVGEEALRLQ